MRRLVVLSAILALESCGLLVGTNETYSNAPDASVTSDAAAPSNDGSFVVDASGTTGPAPMFPSQPLRTTPILVPCDAATGGWHLDCGFGQMANVVVANESTTAPRTAVGTDGYIYTVTSLAQSGGYALVGVPPSGQEPSLLTTVANAAPVDIGIHGELITNDYYNTGITVLARVEAGATSTATVYDWAHGSGNDSVTPVPLPLGPNAVFRPLLLAAPVSRYQAGTLASFVGTPPDGGPAELYLGDQAGQIHDTRPLAPASYVTAQFFDDPGAPTFWLGGVTPDDAGVLEWAAAPEPVIVTAYTSFPITALQTLGFDRVIAIGPTGSSDAGNPISFAGVIAAIVDGGSTMLVGTSMIAFDRGFPPNPGLTVLPSDENLDGGNDPANTRALVLLAAVDDAGTLQLARVLVTQANESLQVTVDETFGPGGQMSIQLGSSFAGAALSQVTAAGDSYYAALQLPDAGAAFLLKVAPPGDAGAGDR